MPLVAEKGLTAVLDDRNDLAVFADPRLGDVMLQIHLSFTRDIHNIQRQHYTQCQSKPTKDEAGDSR